jgi:hypothetical protein
MGADQALSRAGINVSFVKVRPDEVFGSFHPLDTTETNASRGKLKVNVKSAQPDQVCARSADAIICSLASAI